MNQVLEMAGCTRDAFNKWLARGYLNTALEETTQGKARGFTLENALELAFISALSRFSFPLEAASEKAKQWLGAWQQDRIAPFFVFNPKTLEIWGFGEDIKLSALRNLAADEDETEGELVVREWVHAPYDGNGPRPAEALGIIAIRDIINRIEGEFTAQ